MAACAAAMLKIVSNRPTWFVSTVNKIVRRDITQVVRSKYHATSNLVLNAEIHLHRTRSHVVRSEQGCAGTVYAVGECVAHVDRIDGGSGCDCGSLILSVRGHDLLNYAADGLSAKCCSWRNWSSLAGQRIRYGRTIGASFWVKRNNPLASRPGGSNRLLFQIEFS